MSSSLQVSYCCTCVPVPKLLCQYRKQSSPSLYGFSLHSCSCFQAQQISSNYDYGDGTTINKSPFLTSPTLSSLRKHGHHAKNKIHQQQPWTVVEFDYSAANEFIQAHYGDNAPSNPYFAFQEKQEKVYNARYGILDDNKSDTYSFHNAALCQNGFALHYLPTNITNYNNLTIISDVYNDKLEQLLKREFEANNSSLSHVTFWNPMVRGEGYNSMSSRDANSTSTPTASIANMVHIDTDIGEYSNIRDIVTLVQNNRLNRNLPFRTEEIIHLLEKGHCSAIINFWKNIRSEPISQSPLGIFFTKYDTTKNVDFCPLERRGKYTCFPYAIPDPRKSRWYTFPQTTKD